MTTKRDIDQNDYYFCGYTLGVVPTMTECARGGCVLCAGELDDALDDSYLEG